MKYIFYFAFLFLIIKEAAFADIVELTNYSQAANNIGNDYIEQLNYAENNILQRNETCRPILSRLEKLEMILFGAIQAGDLGYRIGNVYQSSSHFGDRRYRVNYLDRHNNFYHRRYNDYYDSRWTIPYNNGIYYPYSNNLPIQTLPRNYSLGSTVRIID